MYCNNCGFETAESDKFCKKCGTPVNPPAQEYQEPPVQQPSYQAPVQQASGYEATVQQPPIYKTPMQQTSEYQALVATDRDIWGRFGGLMVYGALIILAFIIGTISSGHFLKSPNFGNVGKQIIVLLPAAFAVGLTVKHKGLDVSFPAMAALASVICCMTQTLALGILISLLVCIAIGVINAVCIHFLKLPGMLVTISIYIIVSYVFRSLVIGGKMVKLDAAPGLMYVVALIAAIIAVGIALLSSIGKDNRNKFWSTLVVYVGSGVLAVLYVIALSVRIKAVVPYYPAWMVPTIVLIAAFLCITRFFKSKALGIVFAIIPTIFAALINNVLILANVEAYYQQLILLGLIIILLFILFYRGRAQLLGHSLDKQYKAKSWIALIPLLLLLLKNIIMAVVLLTNPSMPSPLYMTLTSVYTDIILLVVAVGICIVHALVKPKGSNIV